MAGWYRFLALSDHWAARATRRVYRYITNFSVPAPRILFAPILSVILVVRFVWYFLLRVFICEPLFKAYCTRYGRNLRTGVYLHWVQGRGDIIIGDHVTVDGHCNFFFAARYTERPTLVIGDHTLIGHGCSITVGQRITIGKHCLFATQVRLFDVSGHPSDPATRLAGQPAPMEEVRPITIADNVWLGVGATVFPGVTIGENSVVSAGAVVMQNVPANTVVAGNPARQVRSLVPPQAGL